MPSQKVLVVSNTPFFGGGESFIENTLTRLGEEMYYLVADETLAARLPADRVLRFAEKSFVGQLHETRRAVAELSPDCVIFNGGRTLFFVPLVRARRKVLYRHTTNQCVSSGPKRWVYNTLLHICYACADAVVHVSDFARNEQKLFRNKAVYIHHGVISQPRMSKPGEGPVRFLFVGRTEPDKGIEIIVDAFSRLPAGTATLDIVGTGESAPWLEQLNTPGIRYHGFSSQATKWYAEADVFISLPRHEAFGLTILEAMNHSLPVITCRAGGVTEIVRDGENAIVVSRDAQATATAMLRMCLDRTLIATMSRNSHAICQQYFTLDRTTARIEQIINP